MAILEQPKTEGESGFKKKFEEGTEAILFDFIQGTQYQYPIPSAIRELVSNCRDSINEKQRFFLINSGKAKVEDFYIDRDGELFKDSKYDPSYYNEKWLSKTRNEIQLIYKVNNNAQRDTFHIIDTGVGLGGLRLEKHFNPLYSTKRNSKDDLGKFGVGSKAGLALDIPYYGLITRYNGMEFHFNVYGYKVDSIVPRFNLTTGEENPFYEMVTQENLKVHYYPTAEPNGVEVILQAKKGLKKDFIEAVKSQLLYLDGIKFEIHEDSQVLEQEVKAKIEYEDDIFVMPTKESTYYSKPHLILNGICYGYVNFLMLEEEERVGNIGMKINPSLVDITMNRESVRWTEKTREAIHSTFKEGEHIAEKLLNAALVSDDLIDWALKSATAVGGMDKGSVIGRFSNIVELKSIKPKFKPLPKIKFSQNPSELFTGYDVVEVTKTVKYSKAKGVNINSLSRNMVHNWGQVNGKQIFYQEGDTHFRQEMFMLTIYPHGFIKVIPKGRAVFKDPEKLSKEELELVEMSYDEWKKLDQEGRDKAFDLQFKKFKQDQELVDQLLRDSKFTEFYESIVVPEDFRANEKEEDEDTEAAIEEVKSNLTPAELRALENRMVATGFYGDPWNYRGAPAYRRKREPKIKEVLQDKGLIIYGFQEDEANLSLAGELLGELIQNHPDGGKYISEDSLWNDDLKIMLVSQSNAKYLKPHLFIDDFFMSFNPETKTISMHNKLVKWQTARKIQQRLSSLQFLKNFGIFDPIASNTWQELVEYVRVNYKDLKGEMANHKDGSGTELIQNLELFADKVTELQLFVTKNPGNLQAIAAKSKALFETNEENSFEDALGVELEIYEKLQMLLEVTEHVQPLLNQVNCLVEKREITHAVEQEIREYLDLKGYICIPAQQPVPQVADPGVIIEA